MDKAPRECGHPPSEGTDQGNVEKDHIGKDIDENKMPKRASEVRHRRVSNRSCLLECASILVFPFDAVALAVLTITSEHNSEEDEFEREGWGEAKAEL